MISVRGILRPQSVVLYGAKIANLLTVGVRLRSPLTFGGFLACVQCVSVPFLHSPFTTQKKY